VLDPDEQQVIERELALLDPELRRDPDRIRALLHADFVEFGASGRVWDRASIAAVTSGTLDRSWPRSSAPCVSVRTPSW
jgi:hypothetical protein